MEIEDGDDTGRHCGNCMLYSDDGRWRRCLHEVNTGHGGWPSYVPEIDETCENWRKNDE